MEGYLLTVGVERLFMEGKHCWLEASAKELAIGGGIAG
jgi:hypothetical protein